MRVLLDTHAFLWWVMDNDRLSNRVREIILDRNNQIFFSAASAWELAIKVGTGKLTLPEPIEIYIPTRIANNGFEALAIEVRHTLDIKGNSDCSITPNKLLNYTIYLFTFLPFTTPFISFLL